MLADFGDRLPEQVPEGIDSMELAWLVHRIEQRYGSRVDDDAMERMTTVTGVLEVLAELPPAAHAPGARQQDAAVPRPRAAGPAHGSHGSHGTHDDA